MKPVIAITFTDQCPYLEREWDVKIQYLTAALHIFTTSTAQIPAATKSADLAIPPFSIIICFASLLLSTYSPTFDIKNRTHLACLCVHNFIITFRFERSIFLHTNLCLCVWNYCRLTSKNKE